MNKNAIKKFAIEARKKLIDSVTDKAGMFGITEKSCNEPITKGVDFEVYQTVAGTEVTLNKRQCEQRRRLVSQIHSRGFEAVVEEVAYTWFNRICAIRFMEVNDYLPNRVRVLSSEKEGKMEPDLVTLAPDVDLDLTAQDKEEIINWKLSGTSEDTDKLYCKLFLKQCHQLHGILPGLFETESDYMELLFGISYTNKDDVIYMLVNPDTGIPENEFNVSSVDEEGNPTGQVEIIGWLYQYYNTELKDDTFAKLKKNIKITKERIPAATQLFTPDWIVRYMVENSVGRIWIEHLRAVDPSTDEKATAERFGWKYYLPEAEQEDAVNVKLAEIRSTYKNLKPTDITCIDPCMGSGHILIAMFDVLMDIYESAGYDKREAAFEIVEHNIHGLDIDQRAYQLAYFSVMMKGRGYNRRFLRGRDRKPEPKVYAIVESNGINREHLKLFGNSMAVNERMQAIEQMKKLLDTFVDAREYGSIINVDECNWDILNKFTNDLDNNGQISFENVGSEKTQEQLSKLVRVAQSLGKKYDAYVTNPPYLGNKSMSNSTANYLKKNFDDLKMDMFAVFIKKGFEMTKKNGVMGFMTPFVWMFISSFSELRRLVLERGCITSLIQLEYSGFDGATVPICTYTLAKKPVDTLGEFIKLSDFKGVDKQPIKTLEAIRNRNCGYRYSVKSSIFKLFPENVIAYWASYNFVHLFKFCKRLDSIYPCKKGMTTGDNNRFLRMWYEIDRHDIGNRYRYYCKGGGYRRWYGNGENVIDWIDDGRRLREFKGATLRNETYYFKKSVTWGLITSSKFSAREISNEYVIGDAGPVCIPCEREHKYILAFLNSVVATYIMDFLNPTMNFSSGVVGSLPYIPLNEITTKQRIDDLTSLNVNISKDEWDDYETSWDFLRHPLIFQVNTVVEAFEQWQNRCDDRFNLMKFNEEELNRIFIGIYNLKDELTPEVEDTDVSVRKAELERDIRSFISYAVGCMLGRYSLDIDGLIYAGGEWDESKYQSFIPDEDNCIPITDEEYFSDDIVGRFVEFVKTVYGSETLEENLDYIANALGNKGNTSREIIRNYFLKDFYTDHLKVYQKRPIYWLFDSGKENGFKALIYMHRYNADTVGRVRTDYLHKAQKYVETAMQSAQYTIDNASSASEKSKATKAVTKYTKQLAEMKIYDEAIAHIANQRIEIDLDDGVKVNYEKMQGIEVAQEGKKTLKVDLLAKIK